MNAEQHTHEPCFSYGFLRYGDQEKWYQFRRNNPRVMARRLRKLIRRHDQQSLLAKQGKTSEQSVDAILRATAAQYGGRGWEGEQDGDG